jgi:hypothetical protein
MREWVVTATLGGGAALACREPSVFRHIFIFKSFFLLRDTNISLIKQLMIVVVSTINN